jgi:hypothetical protein
MVSPARPIIDHDLLSQLLSELGAKNACHRVGRAAGSLWDDQPDGPVRVLRRRAGRKRAGEERQSESKHAHAAGFTSRVEITARHCAQCNTAHARDNALAPL